LTVLGFMAVIILLIVYILQVSQVASLRFEVSGYRREMAQLFQENKNLEIYYSQANSLAALDPLLEESDYVRVDRVHYIQILEDIVAAK